MGGSEDIAIGDFEDVVAEERLGLRAEHSPNGEIPRWKGQKSRSEECFNGTGSYGEVILDQCQEKLQENQDANSITEMAVLKANESNRIRELRGAIFENPENRAKLN